MSDFDHTTEDGLRATVTQLNKSETGHNTLGCLADWLANCGTRLRESASRDQPHLRCMGARVRNSAGPHAGSRRAGTSLITIHLVGRRII